jgi:hypothetical protein
LRRLSLARSPYYHYMEKDDNFRRWVESLERGSITTAAVYYRRIGFLSLKLKVEPSQIAVMNTREARDFIHDTISYLETSGNVGSSIESYIKAVKSWLTWNDIELPKKVKIYGAAETPTVENEVTPVTNELRKIFEVGTLRARAVCGLMAFGAFRPEVFGNLVADDGLRIGDMPELRIEHVTDEKGEVVDGKVSFDKVPTMVVVRKSISKVGHQYFGFLPEEGCRYLQNYLEWRMRPKEVKRPFSDGRRPQIVKLGGERLGPQSPLIAALKIKGPTFVTTPKLGEDIKQAILAAGFKWRPYVLRRYFEVNMMTAEHERLILTEWRQFWMGHAGNIESTYSVNKKLPAEVIETMRQAYAQAAEKHLVTSTEPTIGKDEVINTARVEALKMFGYTDEELQALGDVSKVTLEHLQDLIHEKSKQLLGLNGGTQKVVPVSELEHWIEQGWDYKRDLPNERVVIGLVDGGRREG